MSIENLKTYGTCSHKWCSVFVRYLPSFAPHLSRGPVDVAGVIITPHATATAWVNDNQRTFGDALLLFAFDFRSIPVVQAR
jgi:hypothetical protein